MFLSVCLFVCLSLQAILVVLGNLGKGTGPLIAAAMIIPLGRHVAFMAICVIFSCASITYFATAFTYGRDVAKQVLKVKAQLAMGPDDFDVASQVPGQEQGTGAGQADNDAPAVVRRSCCFWRWW